MKLILHIGTEKTGTTTIQEFLKINRDILENQGILVPKTISTNNGNHRWATVFTYDDDYEDYFTKRHFSKGSQSRKKLINEKLKEFEKEISMSDANFCIISSEHFSSRLKTIENIQNLKKLFSGLFDEISIILYIRKPIEAAVSLLSTQIKSGGTPKGLNLKTFSKYLNNLTIIKNWDAVFFKDNLNIQLFDRNAFIEGDLIKDFCSVCNVEMSSQLINPKKTNETLNLPQMRYLKYLNQYFPTFINNKVNRKRKKLTKFIFQRFKSSNYFLPTKEEYELFEEHFAEDNNYIRIKYFPEKKELWSTYKKGFRQQENVINEISEREIDFLDAIKEIW